MEMDDVMKKFQESLIEDEIIGEEFLLSRHQMVENENLRNGTREALTALRRRARTTKPSVLSPFESIMKEIEGTGSKPLVKEVCVTCGNHDALEKTWMMFPGTDIFARVPFHAAHTILEKDQGKLDYDGNKLQSFVKEQSFLLNEKGVLADKISPSIVRSLVSLTDKAKFFRYCAATKVLSRCILGDTRLTDLVHRRRDEFVLRKVCETHDSTVHSFMLVTDRKFRCRKRPNGVIMIVTRKLQRNNKIFHGD